jgi:hypothetical protein
MSRTDPARKSARAPEQETAEQTTLQQQREALIAPITGGLQALWSKKTLQLTAEEIHLLQLMSTLVRLSDLDVLQTLPVAHQIMPPSDWDS